MVNWFSSRAGGQDLANDLIDEIIGFIAVDTEDLQLRLVSLQRGTSALLGGLQRCFEGFVSPRNCL